MKKAGILGHGHFKTELSNKMGRWATSIMPFHIFSLSLMKIDEDSLMRSSFCWRFDQMPNDLCHGVPPVAIFPSSWPRMRLHRDGECKDRGS